MLKDDQLTLAKWAILTIVVLVSGALPSFLRPLTPQGATAPSVMLLRALIETVPFIVLFLGYLLVFARSPGKHISTTRWILFFTVLVGGRLLIDSNKAKFPPRLTSGSAGFFSAFVEFGNGWLFPSLLLAPFVVFLLYRG